MPGIEVEIDRNYGGKGKEGTAEKNSRRGRGKRNSEGEVSECKGWKHESVRERSNKSCMKCMFNYEIVFLFLTKMNHLFVIP